MGVAVALNTTIQNLGAGYAGNLTPIHVLAGVGSGSSSLPTAASGGVWPVSKSRQSSLFSSSWIAMTRDAARRERGGLTARAGLTRADVRAKAIIETRTFMGVSITLIRPPESFCLAPQTE